MVREGILQRRFTAGNVRAALRPQEAWRPFPKVTERTGWESLTDTSRRRLVQAAEEHLGRKWEELPATLFLEFRRNGNRNRYEKEHFARRDALATLVLGECAEGQGRFLDDVINGVWALCEESFWGIPAHNGRHSPLFPGTGLPDTTFHEVDLFAAETGALLAWTHYLLAEEIEHRLPEARVVPDRVEREMQDRLLEPYRNVDSWRWLGKAHRPVNNWNPWIHSNVLAANLLLEPDAEKRVQTVLRTVEGLDVFLEAYHSDGGCDEGPGYWGRAGASLFDCLEWLYSASDGQLDVYDEPLIREIGRYIYRVHIGDTWYVNYADAPARVSLDGNLVYRYGNRIGDARMMAQGAYAATLAGSRWGRNSIGRSLDEIFHERELAAVDPTPPLVRDTWLDGIQVMAARETAGTTNGLFLSAKGGHNAESHNHNDVGSFVVALDGHPVVIDVGVETYTRMTFGEQRYEIWTMQSLYHNLPAVNGAGQAPGKGCAARAVSAQMTDETAQIQLDIALAYLPEAGIDRWERTIRLERAGQGRDAAQVVLEDEYTLRATPGALSLHLMTSGKVNASEAGVLKCESPTRPLVRYPAETFEARVEEIEVTDARLQVAWGGHVYRVVLEAKSPAAQGKWRLTMGAV